MLNAAAAAVVSNSNAGSRFSSPLPPLFMPSSQSLTPHSSPSTMSGHSVSHSFTGQHQFSPPPAFQIKGKLVLNTAQFCITPYFAAFTALSTPANQTSGEGLDSTEPSSSPFRGASHHVSLPHSGRSVSPPPIAVDSREQQQHKSTADDK